MAIADILLNFPLKKNHFLYLDWLIIRELYINLYLEDYYHPYFVMTDHLNLPSYDIKTRNTDGMLQIFDILRKRYVKLTPEEWVRQHFVHFLKDCHGYPAALMANEVAVSLNGMSRRCDTVVYSRDGLKPLMIVEYKAPEINISQKVFNQICRYNMVLEVEYLIVSNGLKHYCCRVNPRDGSYQFMPNVPSYEEMAQ